MDMTWFHKVARWRRAHRREQRTHQVLCRAGDREADRMLIDLVAADAETLWDHSVGSASVSKASPAPL